MLKLFSFSISIASKLQQPRACHTRFIANNGATHERLGVNNTVSNENERVGAKVKDDFYEKANIEERIYAFYL